MKTNSSFLLIWAACELYHRTWLTRNRQEKHDIKSDTVSALTLTVYLLALALGPLVFTPLSEIYGRRRVINISSVIFTASIIACIFATLTGEQIAFRFLAGIGASTPISIAGSVIADLFILQERALASAIYGWAC